MPFFLFWHLALPLRGLGELILVVLIVRDRITGVDVCALQELSGLPQEGLDAIQCGQFLVGHIVHVLELLAELELHHLLPLFKLHQSLR